MPISKIRERLRIVRENAQHLTKEEILEEVTLIADAAEREIERLHVWVNDLHSGMYVNCVYCGERFGKHYAVPASMSDILKEHIEKCQHHPMHKLKLENEVLRQKLEMIEK